jgi:hypothetical protein
MYARTQIAEMLGISETRVRQLLAVIEARRTGTTEAGKVTEAGLIAITEYRAMGKAAWLAANPEPQPQPQPVATVTEPQPEPVAQPVAFQIVPVDPAAELAIAPRHSGPSNLVPFAPIAQQAAVNIQSTQYAITAARQLVQGVRSRVQIGNETAWAQQQQVTDELAALDLEITQLEVEGQLYRQQQIRTQAVQLLAGDEVGKRLSRLQQLAAANGYQLQPQSC